MPTTPHKKKGSILPTTTMRWFYQKTKGTQSGLSDYRSSANETHAFSKCTLPSPPRGPMSRGPKEAKVAIKRDGFGKGLKDPQEAKMLMLLYGRGFMATPTKMKGKTREHWLNTQSKSLQRKRRVKKMIEGREASQCLLRILESEKDKDMKKERKPLFVRNCVTLRRYFQQERACGFLDDMKLKSKSKDDSYFRVQESGNCFLHAPCVMLAYLGQKHSINKVDAAADVPSYLRSLPDEQLYAYIVKDSGENSVDVLRKLLEPLIGKNIALAKLPAQGIRHYDIAAHLKSFGPGLVSKFKVANNFADAFIPEERKSKIGYMQSDGNLEQQGRFVELVGDQEQQAEVEVHLEAFK